jgi:hypothetical protein
LRFVDPSGLYDLDNTCGDNDKKCNANFSKYAKQLKKAVNQLNKKLAKGKLSDDERDKLTTALKTLGTENDGNGVYVEFHALSGTAAAQTEAFDAGSGKVGFEITFDPSKNSGKMWGVDAAHEGTHGSDMMDPRFNAGKLSPFSLEYRGYLTSSAAAHAFGMGSLMMQKSDKTTLEI